MCLVPTFKAAGSSHAVGVFGSRRRIDICHHDKLPLIVEKLRFVTAEVTGSRSRHITPLGVPPCAVRYVIDRATRRAPGHDIIDQMSRHRLHHEDGAVEVMNDEHRMPIIEKRRHRLSQIRDGQYGETVGRGRIVRSQIRENHHDQDRIGTELSQIERQLQISGSHVEAASRLMSAALNLATQLSVVYAGSDLRARQKLNQAVFDLVETVERQVSGHQYA